MSWESEDELRCDTPFAAPQYINFLKPILFTARDSSSGFQQGYHTFLYSHKKYNRECGRKRINEQYGLRSATSARRVVFWHCIPSAFVDYRWRVFGAKLLQTTRNANSSLKSISLPLDSISRQLVSSAVRCRLRTAKSSWLVSSAVRSRLPLCVYLRQLLSLGSFCQLPSLVFPCPLSCLLSDVPFLPHFWSRQRSRVQALCLVLR